MPSRTANSGARGTADSSGSTSTRTFTPHTSETAHLPAYTPKTPANYFNRLNRIRALREQVSFYPYSPYSYGYPYGYPYGYGYGYGYGMMPWGGYWGSSLLLNADLFCGSAMFWPGSPYSYLTPFGYGFYSPYYFSSSYYFSPFGSSLMLLGSPLGCGFGNSYYGFASPYFASLPYNAQLSSSALSSSCPLCTVNGPDFTSFALDNPFLLSLPAAPLPASLSISNGVAPFAGPAGGALSAAGTSGATFTGNASLSNHLLGVASGNSASGLASAGTERPKVSPSRSVSLVFKSGSTIRARDYWLANGKLHYVTTDGVGHTVPLGRLDMRATMKANRQNGLRFLPPSTRLQSAPAGPRQEERH